MSELVTFESVTDAQDAVRADEICRAIGRALVKHYPHRRWLVDVSVRGGAAKILCPSISMRHAYVMHIHSRTIEQMEREAVRAGGQVLEMFKLSRERGASGGEERLAKDHRGEVIQAATGL